MPVFIDEPLDRVLCKEERGSELVSLQWNRGRATRGILSPCHGDG